MQQQTNDFTISNTVICDDEAGERILPLQCYNLSHDDAELIPSDPQAMPEPP